MVCAMAYVFTISLGVEAIIEGLEGELVRKADSWYDCYYSLFQIGLTYLDHLLNECLYFPARFGLYPPSQFHHCAQQTLGGWEGYIASLFLKKKLIIY